MSELQTKRLVLRRFRPEDREPFARLNADPEVTRFLLGPMARRESDALVERIEQHFETHGFGPWAVEVREGAPFIGFVGLLKFNFEAPFTPNVEVAWRLSREAWGKGYASEAAREALRFAFEERGLPEVVSFTVPANERSRRVMERLGMRRDPGEDFDHPEVPVGHPLRRHVLYRLPRGVWEEARGESAQD